jgi:hypothetical protein
MHARLVIFKLGPGQHTTIKALVREFGPLHRAQPGFKELFVIAGDPSGQHGSFSVWESQADADAANISLGWDAHCSLGRIRAAAGTRRGETPAAPLISGCLHRPGAHARSR